MNVTIEEINKIKRKLIVELPEEKALATCSQFVDTYTRKARIKGFRPGKAPRSMVAKIYANELRQEVLEHLISETVPPILKDHDFQPVGVPQLEIVNDTPGQPFKFSVTLELKPNFVTPEWRGLELQRRRRGITEAQVDKKIEELRLSLATIKKIEDDRPLALGDLATVNYKAVNAAGKTVPRYTGGPYNVELTENSNLAPELLAGLVGMKVGETKDITLNISKDNAKPKIAELKSDIDSLLTLTITVTEIKTRELPELDDEFTKDLGLEGIENLPTLRVWIFQKLEQEKEEQDINLFNQQLTHLLANLVEIEVPTAMVELEINKRLEVIRANLARDGLDFNKIGVDVSQLRERTRPLAKKSVVAALILDQIGRDNQVDTAPGEIEEELVRLSNVYGQSVEVVREHYQTQGLMTTLREGLKINKTLNLIRSQSTIVEVDTIESSRIFGYNHPDSGTAEGGLVMAESGGEIVVP
ncbi:MAG: trigger factor [Candidatus Adiutrix intracellularis]|jgi:trigger factor|nr:trigger factor [Candidatus Adiutrix intracellularis]